MARARENRPKCTDDRLSWHKCLSDEERGDCSSASPCGCCCQGPWSSDTNLLLGANSKPTRSSRWLCNLFWGKLFTVNVEETHFLINIIQVNLATPTIKCGVERALLKSCASPLPASPEGWILPKQLVSIKTLSEGPELLGSCRLSHRGVCCAVLRNRCCLL